MLVSHPSDALVMRALRATHLNHVEIDPYHLKTLEAGAPAPKFSQRPAWHKALELAQVAWAHCLPDFFASLAIIDTAMLN